MLAKYYMLKLYLRGITEDLVTLTRICSCYGPFTVHEF